MGFQPFSNFRGIFHGVSQLSQLSQRFPNGFPNGFPTISPRGAEAGAEPCARRERLGGRAAAAAGDAALSRGGGQETQRAGGIYNYHIYIYIIYYSMYYV